MFSIVYSMLRGFLRAIRDNPVEFRLVIYRAIDKLYKKLYNGK